MILKSLAAICILIVSLSSSAFCEYYQYTDEKGVKHFTDNILEVPENQRKKMNIHQSLQSEEDEAQSDETLNRESPAEILIRLKGELAQEFTDLTQKKDNFEKMDQETDPEEYKSQAEQLTREIEAYNKKYQDYENQLAEFNSKVPPPEANAEEDETTGEEEETATEDEAAGEDEDLPEDD